MHVALLSFSKSSTILIVGGDAIMAENPKDQAQKPMPPSSGKPEPMPLESVTKGDERLLKRLLDEERKRRQVSRDHKRR